MTQAAGRAYRLAVFTKNWTNPAYAGARLGTDRLAHRLGCTVTHYVPGRADDVEEQRALLATALAEGADAILLAPTHATALNDILSGLPARGIPLLCFVSSPVGIEPACFVGADDRELAAGIADYLFDHIAGRGNGNAYVVSIEGHANAMTSAPRAGGFRAAAAARAGVRIVNSLSGDFQFDGGKAAMAALLQAEARIDGVLAANDAMALGAIEVMRQHGRLSAIVGVNATPDGVKAVKNGALLASAAFDAMKMACLAVEAAVRMLSGNPVPVQLMLPVEIVDRSNCELWDRPYAARSLPDWHQYVKR
jgi:ribose transport system substrate-binding protein